MKTRIQLTKWPLVAALVLGAVGCENDKGPDASLTVAIRLADSDREGFSIDFIPGEGTERIRYVLAPAGVGELFAANRMPDVRTAIGDAPTTVRFAKPGNESFDQPYSVYAQAYGYNTAGEVYELNVTDLRFPGATVEFDAFNAFQAAGTVRFNEHCTGANLFVSSFEQYEYFLWRYNGGMPDVMMQAIPWAPVEDIAFDLNEGGGMLTGRPGESKLVIGVAFWTGERQVAGYRILEFTAPEADPSLPLPGAPEVAIEKIGEQVVRITIRGDENTVALALTEQVAQADEYFRNVEAYLAPEQSYSRDSRQKPVDEFSLAIEVYNANGIEGATRWKYTYSFLTESLTAEKVPM